MGLVRGSVKAFETLENRQLLSSAYYSFDGSGNNLAKPHYGQAGVDLLKHSGTAYGDGVSTLAGQDRVGARVISNTVGEQITDPEPNNRNLADMIYAWGQFVDHDLDLTPASPTEAQAIPVPTGDPTFDPTGAGGKTIPFTRTVIDATSGTSKANPRKQPNIVSAFLDGSMVYGIDATRARALRTLHDGRLKTSAGDLLPINTDNLPETVDIPGVDPRTLFVAGDGRVNENVELTAVQTVFLREHNYWAAQFKAAHPKWSDETLYQHARQIVIAEIQNITYNEYLPALMGTSAIPAYAGYNAKVNPNIAAEFSEAAYRFGHSMLNGNVDFFANDGTESHDPLDFSASADDPSVLAQPGTGVAEIMKYLADDNAQELDNHVEDAFRNFLFDPTNHAGTDLYSIDIQRARDVGIPDYNTVRAAYGLPKVKSFSEITSDKTLQAKLKNLYGNVNDMDLFVAGLAENHVSGSSLGPTFQAIIAQQFENIRNGDRLWYQNTFTGSTLERIQSTTLSDVISRNTDISNLQPDVFFFKTGTITGTVFADSNHNGAINAGETGLSGVTVTLFNGKGVRRSSTVTDADGDYSFDTGVQNAGEYVLVQTPTGAGKATTPQLQRLALVDNSGAGAFHVDFGFAKPTARKASAATVKASAVGTMQWWDELFGVN